MVVNPMHKTYARVTSCCGKEVAYNKGEKPLVCPFCGNVHWDKPQDEFTLFTLQDSYFEKGRSPKVLEEMYRCIFSYSRNIILKKIRGKTHFSTTMLQDRIEDLSTLMIEKYLIDPEFRVKVSFGGIMKRMSAGTLYRDQDEDKPESFDMGTPGSTSREFGDVAYDPFSFDLLNPKNSEDPYDSVFLGSRKVGLVEELDDILEKVYWVLIDNKVNFGDRLMFLLGVRLFAMRVPWGEASKFYSLCNQDIHRDVETFKLVIFRFLKEASGGK